MHSGYIFFGEKWAYFSRRQFPNCSTIKVGVDASSHCAMNAQTPSADSTISSGTRERFVRDRLTVPEFVSAQAGNVLRYSNNGTPTIVVFDSPGDPRHRGRLDPAR
jgi:hypothetical protein